MGIYLPEKVVFSKEKKAEVSTILRVDNTLQSKCSYSKLQT